MCSSNAFKGLPALQARLPAPLFGGILVGCYAQCLVVCSATVSGTGTASASYFCKSRFRLLNRQVVGIPAEASVVGAWPPITGPAVQLTVSSVFV